MVFIVFVILTPVLAQQPSRIQTEPIALQALGERVGVPGLNLSSLVNWSWSFGTYDYVVSQGCLGAPSVAPRAGGWQRYVFNYRGIEYVYLISDDTQSLFLCNEAALGTAVPSPTVAPPTATPSALSLMTATPLPVASNTPVATTPSCSLPPRLSAGGGARVTPGEPNWVHAAASRQSAKTGEIPAEEVFQVLEGPVCDAAAGMYYWRVRYQNQIGWTSEGLGEYWLEPIIVRVGFTIDNAAQAVSAEWLQAYPAGINAIAFSTFGTVLAILEPNGTVILYDSRDLSFIGQLARTEPVEHMALSHDGLYMATSVANGTVYTWDITSQRALGQAVHGGDVTALAFSPVRDENRILVVADTTGIVWLWNAPVVTPTSLPLIKLSVTGMVASLEFSPDASVLVAKDESGAVLGAWQIR